MAQSLTLRSIMALIRWAIALVFLIAGALKIADPGLFLEDIQAYRLLPYGLAFATALILPWLEVFASLAVLCKRWDTGALLSLTLIILVFTLALASAWIRGLDINCGCFGHNPETSSNYPLAILRNSAIFLGLVGLLLAKKPKKMPPVP